MSDSDHDLGGEAPCLLPLFEPREVVVAALDEVSSSVTVGAGEPGGAVWSLPHDGDLDANLVVLHPGEVIGTHVNREVDVLLVVRGGDGELTVDGGTIRLRTGTVALVPRDRSRSIRAGADGVEYLSIHRRRGGLRIS